MKSCIFHELLLVSHAENRARSVPFHSKTTVVKGPNDTGKSSILKSIFATLGASPAQSHDRWKSANVSTLLFFSVDGARYVAYRQGSTFALFSESEQHLKGTYTSVTNELGPALAKLFDFKLTLANRDGRPTSPPPSYLLLPYYIDQDKGWTSTWASFANLQQFNAWKTHVVSYHAGIRPNEWYAANAALQAVVLERQEPLSREHIVRQLHSDVAKTLAEVPYDVDLETYRKEVDRLAEQHDRLAAKEDAYRQKLLDLDAKRAQLTAQLEIVRRARVELAGDYDYLGDAEPLVQCPTCGAEYCTGIVERFEIARDENRCAELLNDLQEQLSKVALAIEEHKTTLTAASTEADAIRSLLAASKGKATLHDLIRREGTQQLASSLDGELSKLSDTLGKLDAKGRHLREQLARLENKERADGIRQEYRTRMASFLLQLAVHSLPERSYRRIDCAIKETGSDLPRAILAYAFSMLHVIRNHGSGTYFPVVVDAPNQQEQDRENHKKMLEFIRDHRPKDTQVILGLVDDVGVVFDGDVVTLDEKNFALRKEDYQVVAARIRPFADAVLGSRD